MPLIGSLGVHGAASPAACRSASEDRHRRPPMGPGPMTRTAGATARWPPQGPGIRQRHCKRQWHCPKRATELAPALARAERATDLEPRAGRAGPAARSVSAGLAGGESRSAAV